MRACVTFASSVALLQGIDCSPQPSRVDTRAMPELAARFPFTTTYVPSPTDFSSRYSTKKAMTSSSHDSYPGLRTHSESERLQAQHLLYKLSLGLVLAPLDLQQPNLRVLDSGTADGYWLADLASHLSPDASLIGTDIATYDTHIKLPSNVELLMQNIKHSWPVDWQGSFDLVHQRLVLSNVADHTAATQAIYRLIELVKPGGWIQLDESAVLEGPSQPSDSPCEKVYRVVGNFMRACGMNPMPAAKVRALLEEAGAGMLDQINGKTVEAKLGRGAPTRELENAGMANFMGIMDGVKAGLGKFPNPPMSPEEFESMRPECRNQLVTTGTQMRLTSVWAQRRSS